MVSDTSRGKAPVSVFTGDNLFVGDVGRPDMFPDIVQELAGKLYHSLNDKIMKLPDFCEVLPTFAGWVLPLEKDLLLVADNFDKAVKTNVWLRRVGQDRVVGYLDGGMSAWAVSGYKTHHITQISAEEIHDMVTGSSKFVMLDVRAPQEFEDTHIKGAINIPVDDLRHRHKELNKKDIIILICSTGNRSSLGTSILSQHGFKNLYNAAGGMTGYSAAGYAKQCNVCLNPHGSRFFSKIDGVSRQD